MGKGRVRHIYAKLAVLRGQRGIALINALAFSIMIGLLIAGIYTGISILFKSTEEMRTFTSVREAAAAGARYAASMATYFGRNPRETYFPGNPCETYNLEFKITGRDSSGEIKVTMCRIGASSSRPDEKTGASYSPTGDGLYDPFSTGTFKIVSEARFGDQVSRVEAVYEK
ncbi:MAG: hypothetical protein ACK4FY_08005 [Aquificaceae bacterium]